MRVDFYFDFLSPYSYLANHRLSQLAQEYVFDVEYHAMDLAKAKIAIGNVGPANRDLKVKLEYLKDDLQRWAGLYGIPLVFPPNFNSARLNVGTYYPVAKTVRAEYVQFAYDRVWGKGIAPDDDTLVDEIARNFGWDDAAFREFLSGDAGRAAYEAATDAAIARKVFGVPTIFFEGEMWWGNDRLFLLERALKDRREQEQEQEQDRRAEPATQR